ncbi:MAG: cytochrome c oxidase subunit II [Xanthomonadales bacterium]|nr:cytochrome c oxidase subunit II [Xanthomonadales bacterium]
MTNSKGVQRRSLGGLFHRAATLALLTLMAAPAWADYALNLTQGVSEFSERVYGLHMLILWICVVIGVLVFGAMFVSMYLHRKSRGHEPAQFSHSTKAEIVWTVIPILILVGMAIPATNTLVYMHQTGDSDMTVKITGYQWKWKYDYIEDDVSFLSNLDSASNSARQLNSGIDPATVDDYLLNVDNRVVLPINTKVRFLITADDVIHAWWVPDFGWKRDAIPGFVNEAWVEIKEPGIYRGQCAELCGKDHGFMPIVVEAVSRPAYQAWVDEQKQEQLVAEQNVERDWSQEELVAHGQAVYEAQCAACHQLNGQGLAPAFPALAGSPVANGPTEDHIDVVVNGRPGTAMQAFGDTLNEADIAAALTYTRSAWGNKASDTIQPRDVRAAKRG